MMKVTVTAKLKLQADAAQFNALRVTQLAYRDGLNSVSCYAFEHGKISNKVRLQDGTYDELRTRFKIPAQMACSIPPSSGGHLQDALDQGEAECGTAQGRDNQETV